MIVGKNHIQHKETDMYFYDSHGDYKFNPSELKAAHAWCQNEVNTLMRFDYSPVVVSNTFTQEWEMEPYYKMAKKYGYQVHSVIVENRHGGVNQHNVPEDKLQQMKDRFQVKL